MIMDLQISLKIVKNIFSRRPKNCSRQVIHVKLTPTPVDREVFFDILNTCLSDVRRKYRDKQYGGRYVYWNGITKGTPLRALRAYEVFIKKIKSFIGSDVGDDIELEDSRDEIKKRLVALLEALVFHLKLIVIELDENDDAQVIFETLNSAGQPLLAMDLVRNNIFHRAEAQFNNSDVTDHNEIRHEAELLYKGLGSI